MGLGSLGVSRFLLPGPVVITAGDRVPNCRGIVKGSGWGIWAQVLVCLHIQAFGRQVVCYLLELVNPGKVGSLCHWLQMLECEEYIM